MAAILSRSQCVKIWSITNYRVGGGWHRLWLVYLLTRQCRIINIERALRTLVSITKQLNKQNMTPFYSTLMMYDILIFHQPPAQGDRLHQTWNLQHHYREMSKRCDSFNTIVRKGDVGASLKEAAISPIKQLSLKRWDHLIYAPSSKWDSLYQNKLGSR